MKKRPILRTSARFMPNDGATGLGIRLPHVMFAPEDGTGTGDAPKDPPADPAPKDPPADPPAPKDPPKDPPADPDKPGMSDADAKLLKELMARKDEAKTLTDQLKAANDRLSQFGDIDPVKAKELSDAARAAEQASLEAKGEFDRVKLMMAEEHSKEVDKLVAAQTEKDTQISSMQKQIDDLTIGNSFATSDFLNETVYTASKARQIYGPHFERNAAGVTVAYDKPAGATDRTPLVDAAGAPLPFEAAFKKIVESDPEASKILKSGLKGGAKSGTDNEEKGGTVPSGLRGVGLIAANLAKMAKK